ncbi:CopD superfamily membrane protein [Erythrobacter litoralis]|jgi:putative membrane protein|uniref:Protoporphyrinogen IX oxidase n=1 Tax=Erythrobacter litoralis TaxID=39960 RepID=A0A074MXR6_9SPHN|nr:CopD family protein [Erythrobacter litoralis]AOL21968.1 CopD superfamily membrane protein [Erythrobacter litoralis]KEO96588.1 membrane protein [Erythrobacter litoralis]MEE4338850.1 CopD family protein [Erythrobacter sp.]
MREAILTIYPWLVSGHVIFMTFWLAGLFMLPRQCIYMLDAAPGSAEEAQWARRMGLLRKIILTPSLIVVWVLGLTQAWAMGYFTEGWIHIKITLVLLLTGYHGWLVAKTKKMARGERPLTESRLRMIGEIPGVLLVLIVVTVYVVRSVLA